MYIAHIPKNMIVKGIFQVPKRSGLVKETTHTGMNVNTVPNRTIMMETSTETNQFTKKYRNIRMNVRKP
jgi:hypothetical protein